MKRDFQKIWNNANSKENVFSQHYSVFRAASKLHEELDSLSNSLKRVQISHIQPTSFQKLHQHHEKAQMVVEKNPKFIQKKHYSYPLSLQKIEHAVARIGQSKEENKDKTQEFKEENRDTFSFLEKRNSALKNMMNQGNISVASVLSMELDNDRSGFPLIAKNLLEKSLILGEEKKKTTWNDLEVEALLSAIASLPSRKLRRSQKPMLFDRIFGAFKAALESQKLSCEKTVEDIIRKLQADVKRLIEKNREKNLKTKSFYTIIKDFEGLQPIKSIQ